MSEPTRAQVFLQAKLEQARRYVEVLEVAGNAVRDNTLPAAVVALRRGAERLLNHASVHEEAASVVAEVIEGLAETDAEAERAEAERAERMWEERS